MNKIILAIISMATLAFSQVSYAADAIIEWTAPVTYIDGLPLDPDTEILSYTIYYGTESGNYTEQVTIGSDAREYTFTGLSGTYYFVATATSVELDESNYSNEVTRKFTKGKPSTFTIQFRS